MFSSSILLWLACCMQGGMCKVWSVLDLFSAKKAKTIFDWNLSFITVSLCFYMNNISAPQNTEKSRITHQFEKVTRIRNKIAFLLGLTALQWKIIRVCCKTSHWESWRINTWLIYCALLHSHINSVKTESVIKLKNTELGGLCWLRFKLTLLFAIYFISNWPTLQKHSRRRHFT